MVIGCWEASLTEFTSSIVYETKMTITMEPNSCDTFVALPNVTKNKTVIFGKNSDRPNGEVQEVVYCQAADHPQAAKVQCTYIEIDQVDHTHAVILSKPAWMWGAEMGANEHGVCIGNEAIWAKDMAGVEEERLLGMDILRLALERSTSAEEALDIVINMLELHGQGGPCSTQNPPMTYFNSFLIADPKSAWVLETVDRHWAAEHITEGYRNISNTYSIHTKIDRISDGCKEKCLKDGLWDGSSEFDFAAIFEDGSDGGRKASGEKLLAKHSADSEFTLSSMFEILRDAESRISRGMDDPHPTVASMVSVLSSNGRPNCHWLTGTPDPQRSVFKPFIFTPNATISPYIQSPKYPAEDDPAKVVPRFQKCVNRNHLLYTRHVSVKLTEEVLHTLREMERNCIKETEAFLDSFQRERLKEVDDLFKDCVDSELKFYK